jgi:hypothetical protein
VVGLGVGLPPQVGHPAGRADHSPDRDGYGPGDPGRDSQHPGTMVLAGVDLWRVGVLGLGLGGRGGGVVGRWLDAAGEREQAGQEGDGGVLGGSG